MQLPIKILKVLCGLGLLLVAAGGAVGLCLSSPAGLKAMMVDGTPLVCPIQGSLVRVPGRLAAAAILGVPVISLVAGCWLLKSAFNSQEPDG